MAMGSAWSLMPEELQASSFKLYPAQETYQPCFGWWAWFPRKNLPLCGLNEVILTIRNVMCLFPPTVGNRLCKQVDHEENWSNAPDNQLMSYPHVLLLNWTELNLIMVQFSGELLVSLSHLKVSGAGISSLFISGASLTTGAYPGASIYWGLSFRGHTSILIVGYKGWEKVHNFSKDGELDYACAVTA